MTLGSLLNALLFVAVGVLVFAGALAFVARILPGNLWGQVIREQSLPAAIVLAAIVLALGWIVAAAVH